MQTTSQDLDALREGVIAHDRVEPPMAVALAYLELLGGAEPSLVVSRKMERNGTRWSVVGLVGAGVFELDMNPNMRDNFGLGSTSEDLTVAAIHPLREARGLVLTGVAGEGFGNTAVTTPSWTATWSDGTQTAIEPSEYARDAEVAALGTIVAAIRSALIN